MSIPSARSTIEKAKDSDSSVFSALSQPISSSVPARRGARALSDRSISTGTSACAGSGPKLYDYNLKSQGGASSTGSLTQIRPGLLGRPTAPASLGSAPSDNASVKEEHVVPSKSLLTGVPVPGAPAEDAEGYARNGYRDPPHAAGGSYSSVGASASVGAGGWSLSHSELRSVSESISGSGEDEDESGGSYAEREREREQHGYRGRVGVVDPEAMADTPAAGYGFSGRRHAMKQEVAEADDLPTAEDVEWGVEVDMDMDVDVSYSEVMLFKYPLI